MTLPILHFAHANSYPAGTYRIFFNHLRQHYTVGALDMHGHNPKFPVKAGWEAIAQEMIETLTDRYDRPVILVGHSMGGILSFITAKMRPDLVRCVVLLDSPIVAGWRALVWRLMQITGRAEKISPARFSKKRRILWPDRDVVHRSFAKKEVFASWDPDVLRDYVEHALEPHPEGVTLRFKREIETDLYLTLPPHLGRLARPPFPVPIGFIGGIDSWECRRAGLDVTRRLVGSHFQQLPGGHLFPMEAPITAAQATHQMIQSLLR